MHQTNNPGFLTKSLSDFKFLMSLFWGSSFAPSTYIVPIHNRLGRLKHHDTPSEYNLQTDSILNKNVLPILSPLMGTQKSAKASERST